MKKLLLIVSVAAVFFACSKKNDTKPVVTSVSVVGKWNLDVDTATTYYNNDVESIYLIDQYLGDYYQFNNDGSGLHGLGNSTTHTVSAQSFNYTVSPNNTITLNYPAQTFLGVPQSAYSTSGVIKKVNSTNLVIEFELSTGVPGAETDFVNMDYLSK